MTGCFLWDFFLPKTLWASKSLKNLYQRSKKSIICTLQNGFQSFLDAQMYFVTKNALTRLRIKLPVSTQVNIEILFQQMFIYVTFFVVSNTENVKGNKHFFKVWRKWNRKAFSFCEVSGVTYFPLLIPYTDLQLQSLKREEVKTWNLIWLTRYLF